MVKGGHVCAFHSAWTGDHLTKVTPNDHRTIFHIGQARAKSGKRKTTVPYNDQIADLSDVYSKKNLTSDFHLKASNPGCIHRGDKGVL